MKKPRRTPDPPGTGQVVLVRTSTDDDHPEVVEGAAFVHMCEIAYARLTVVKAVERERMSRLDRDALAAAIACMAKVAGPRTPR